MKDVTKNYYEDYANVYFNQTYAVDLQPLWTRLTRQLKPQTRILDLGCGSGRDIRYFASQGFSIVGLDYANRLLKLARDFTHQPVVLADLNSLPFQDNSFDAVWAIGSLLHVPRQLISHALGEIRRTLKTGAILFSSVKSGQGEEVDSWDRHNVFYLQQEWESMLEAHDYDVVEIKENIEIRHVTPKINKEIAWISCLARAI